MISIVGETFQHVHSCLLVEEESRTALREPPTFERKTVTILVNLNWNRTHLSCAGFELPTSLLTG